MQWVHTSLSFTHPGVATTTTLGHDVTGSQIGESWKSLLCPALSAQYKADNHQPARLL